MSNSKETAAEPDGTTVETFDPPNVIPFTGKTALDRAYEVARAGSTDTEIAATIACEYGLEPDEIRKILQPKPIRARLEAERTAGRAELRTYLFQVATDPKYTSATLQVAMWLSKQMLGYSQHGVEEALQKKIEDLEKLSEDELKKYVLQVAKNLGG